MFGSLTSFWSPTSFFVVGTICLGSVLPLSNSSGTASAFLTSLQQVARIAVSDQVPGQVNRFSLFNILLSLPLSTALAFISKHISLQPALVISVGGVKIVAQRLDSGVSANAMFDIGPVPGADLCFHWYL